GPEPLRPGRRRSGHTRAGARRQARRRGRRRPGDPDLLPQRGAAPAAIRRRPARGDRPRPRRAGVAVATTDTGAPGAGALPAPGAAQQDALSTFLARATGWVLAVGGVIGTAAAFALILDRIALLKDPAFVPSCSISPLLSCGS